MSERIVADIAIIGAGPGGIAVAAAAAQLGARTVLIERRGFGGARLEAAVPTAALIAAAKRGTGFAAAMDAAQAARVVLAPTASAERMASLGVQIMRAEARFLSPREIAAGAATIAARRIVIATGAEPYVPPLVGVDRVPYRTSATIFDGRERPEHLIVVGGGATGLELASAYALLGARVTVLEAERVLGGSDPELAALLAQWLRRADLDIQEGVRAVAVAATGAGVAITCADGRRIEGSHLLFAAGRRAALASLDLAKAGIVCGSAGALVLDRRLRTSNRRVYAVGDAAGQPHSVQRAASHAGIVIRNALFRWPAQADERALPSVVHTVPEFAAVGLGEAEARMRHPRDLAILRWPFFDSDRAQIEGATAGLVKIIARRDGRVLGAQILGEAAGEAIAFWALAISAGLRLDAIAALAPPYPSRAEASKEAAQSLYLPRLLSPRMRRLARLLARLG